MYQSGPKKTSFPNFDILDKQTHEYISQPLWDHKTSVTNTNVSLTTLTFSTIYLAIWSYI